MPRANLKGQAEVEFLKKAVRTTFEKQANRTLVANTNKGNYVRLAEEISEIASAEAHGTRLEKMDMTVSEGQVRSLFMESNKDFLDYFVQACYFYSQGISREDFLAAPENNDLIKTWEQENGDKSNGSNLNELFLQEKTILENQIVGLKKRLKGVFLVVCLVLGSIVVAFLSYRSQINRSTERLNIWTGNINNIQKENLLPYLDFLQPNADFLNI